MNDMSDNLKAAITWRNACRAHAESETDVRKLERGMMLLGKSTQKLTASELALYELDFPFTEE